METNTEVLVLKKYRADCASNEVLKELRVTYAMWLTRVAILNATGYSSDEECANALQQQWLDLLEEAQAVRTFSNEEMVCTIDVETSLV